MPLWPTDNLRVWTGSNFTEFKPEEILLEYDGPVTAVIRDSTGNLIIAHIAGDDSRGTSRYILSPTTSNILKQLKEGTISLRTAIDQPILWVADVDGNSKFESVWSAVISELPTDILPRDYVMLSSDMEPLLRIRAIGPSIEPGNVPADVVKYVVSGAESAVRRLVKWITNKQKVGRPADEDRQLYRLQAQQFRFASFEVAFRPVEPLHGQTVHDNVNELMSRVSEMLSRGLEWSQTGNPPSRDPDEANVILEAIMDMSPRQGSGVVRTEITGRVASPLIKRRIALTSQTRQLASMAIRDLRRELPNEKVVIIAGSIVKMDLDRRNFEIRGSRELGFENDQNFIYSADQADGVMDAFSTRSMVAAFGRLANRQDRTAQLLKLEVIRDIESAQDE